MLNRSRLLAVALMSLWFAAACGQKGPLYLPGDPSRVTTDVPRQGNAPQQQSDEDAEEEDSDEDDDS